MKKTEQLPGIGDALLLGRDEKLFSCLPPGITRAPSLPVANLPRTVFLAEKDSPGGRKSLAECLNKKIPFVVIGRGWSRGLPSFPVTARGSTMVIGPGSAGLTTDALGPGGGAVVLATGSRIFDMLIGIARQRSVPVEYGLSFGKKSDLGSLETAWQILEGGSGGRFFLFIKDRLKRGREMLEFAAETARRGSITGILEYDPLPGDDGVETAALRQIGIIRLREPCKAVDVMALFSTFQGKIPAGIFPDFGRGELAAMARSGLSRRNLLSAKAVKAPDPSSPRLKIASGGKGLVVAGGPAYSLIPGIERGFDALSLILGAGTPKPCFTDDGDGPPNCPIHPRPTEYDAKILLKTFGIPVAREQLCRSFKEAGEAAGAIGYPVALKVMSPAILHKSEARVIALNLQDEEELRNAYGRTLEKARIANPGAKIRGVLVQEMVRGGAEWRMEFRRDLRFGPIVEISAGGIFGDLLSDGVIRVAPFGLEEAHAMIRESRGSPLLMEGWLRESLDVGAFAAALSAFSRLAFCEQEVSRLEVNPVFVNKKGVLVVDAFLELKGRGK